MTLEEFETLHDVRLIRKDRSKLMAAIGVMLWPVNRDFMRYWTTLRLPFGKSTIYYRKKVTDPTGPRHAGILRHEMVHVEQQRGAWGLSRSIMLCLFFPLPFFLSGRWYLERPAYLGDIQAGTWTIEQVVRELWHGYGWAWPRGWMRQWFEEQTAQGDKDD